MERCENDVCGLDKYKQVVQLHDKDENSKEYPIFPVTYTHAVYDGKTGANLESMLAQFNNVFLQYQGTAKDTRLLLPKEMRRKGVQITYRNMDDEVVTEKCVNDSQSDNDHWGLDANWMRIDELSLQGDISVSKSGTWIINGADTGVKALGPKGDNGLTPWMKTIDNKLYYSYDNQTWELASDYIAAWFRFTGTSGSSQAGNIGKIQISRDEGKTWADLSGTFTNNLHIKGYVATTSDLPSSAVQGDIYGVGPTYAESDTEHTNPIYRLFVKNENVWVDNGQFTSIAAGVVQELGESETEVVSQKTVTNEIEKLKKKVIITFDGFVSNITLISEKFEGEGGLVKYNTDSNKFVYDVEGTYYNDWTDSLLYGIPYSYGMTPYNRPYFYGGKEYYTLGTGNNIYLIQKPNIIQPFDTLLLTDYLYNTYYDPVTGIETYEPSRLTTDFIQVEDGQVVSYGIYGYDSSIAIAAFDSNMNIILNKCLIINSPSSILKGTYEIDPTIRYIRITRLNNAYGINQAITFNISDCFSLIRQSYKGIIRLDQENFDIQDVYLNPVTGEDTVNELWSATNFITVSEDEKIYYKNLYGTDGGGIIAFYDRYKKVINIIRGSNTYETGIISIPKNTNYVRFSAVMNIPFNIQIISDVNRTQLLSESKSDIFVKGFDNFFVSGTWSREDNNLIVTGGGFTQARHIVDTYEDEFTMSCKVMVTSDSDDNFETGIGKTSITPGYTDRWITLCKNASGSFLKTYYRVDGSYTEQTNVRQILAEPLLVGNWYVLQMTKTTDAKSSITGNLYNDKTGELLASFTTNEAAYAWGYPVLINITGQAKFTGFSMYYPKNNYPKIAIYGDSFIEGDTIRNTKNLRYSALLQEIVGKKGCIILGHGGATSKSDNMRTLSQIEKINSSYAILAYGNNDADWDTWWTYIEYMLKLCKLTDTTPVFVTVTPRVGQNDAYITKITTINDWIRSSGYSYIDANKACTIDGLTWRSGYVMDDGVHPTVLGHKAIFDRINIDCSFLF